MSKPSGSSEPAGAVDVTTLSVPQLRALQTRLSTELEHLTTSHAKLRTAQSKFRECIRSINDGVVKSATEKAKGKSEILVPLTNSLYVKGQLADREKVIVDVGTGFYVEKSTSKAIEFYNGKVEELQTNLRDLEKVLQAKTTNHRVIEDVLRQKLLAGEGAAVPSSSGGGGGA
ncbi:Prefoldin subunit domain containing protein [Coccidioides posadasii C735 delta SOWgp]|uniref:Prefoldin subunit domain containing protein n=1 Tax=Coccidioides posadasii (strain C735) TaxID=222929 RepID=C5P5H2_COCP7|nr:Prefoldin subunit domain containing protein [Coccidioides posadasii C735 delta SOWgp]EER27962.1 Prefoldin subunit domain containing protein [Coccidioides posadasii C735 delta SOWgp]|eukprot:XP_003070107.1 Prefoldin subunit domain containing protein [Coccidioides posadasii C735 delta SOWgp]